MKIGISCHPAFGGSGAVASGLAVALAERGHEVHLFSHDKPFRWEERDGLSFHLVENVNYPLFKFPPYPLSLASVLADAADEYGLEILNPHYAVPDAASAYMAKRLVHGRVKIVTTLHGTDVTVVGSDTSLYRITEFALEHSDGIICVSKALKRKAQETFSLTRDIEVIYNFVDCKRFSPERCPVEKKREFARGSQKIVVHVSNFRPVKRTEDVVRVFAKVRESIDSKLVMIGDGPDRDACRALAERLGVQGDVVFHGTESAIEDILCVGDLFLLPSAQESFGLAALEAMCSGMPVIATNVGGLPEVVVDGETGYLFRVGDIDSMASAAVDLLNDDTETARQSANARERAARNFAKDLLVPKYEAHFQRVLSKAA
jgi:N-acetyl-alpha-D-glucosaminyl L-malate synthase BshA